VHRFLDELLARVTRAGARGPKLLRADSGFWSKATFDRLDRAGWQFSIGVRLHPAVRVAIDAIDEDAWTTLEDYPPTSIAQIAETLFNERRLVVRRVRTLDRQGELLPSWELFPFLTNRTEPLTMVEAEHRRHAVVELAIRDLKDQALAHFPSGKFMANAAWTVIAALAHNLLRWTSVLGLPGHTIRAARTVRRRLLPARPPHPHGTALDAAPARPLALAARLHRSAHPHPRTHDRRLTTDSIPRRRSAPGGSRLPASTPGRSTPDLATPSRRVKHTTGHHHDLNTPTTTRSQLPPTLTAPNTGESRLSGRRRRRGAGVLGAATSRRTIGRTPHGRAARNGTLTGDGRPLPLCRAGALARRPAAFRGTASAHSCRCRCRCVVARTRRHRREGARRASTRHASLHTPSRRVEDRRNEPAWSQRPRATGHVLAGSTHLGIGNHIAGLRGIQRGSLHVDVVAQDNAHPGMQCLAFGRTTYAVRGRRSARLCGGEARPAAIPTTAMSRCSTLSAASTGTSQST
jgi:hypothetical protein